MTTIDRLAQWKNTGLISDNQYAMLSSLVRKEWFSIFFELNALLYIGVLSLVGGLGWTVQTHFANLGDLFILSILSLSFIGSLYYCFSAAQPYSNAEVESPNFAFDYVLYASCLVFSVELAYIEFRFVWLHESWPNYLLVSSVLFFVLAYRFDNRFVLSLALSSLAGWLGVSLSRRGLTSDPLRLTVLLYGSMVIAIGTYLYRLRIKKHFIDTYLHIAANAIFAALLSGVLGDSEIPFLLGLLTVTSLSIALGIQFKRFVFVAYGTVYGYIGVSSLVLRELNGFSAGLTYLVITGTTVIIVIAMLARRFAREE